MPLMHRRSPTATRNAKASANGCVTLLIVRESKVTLQVHPSRAQRGVASFSSERDVFPIGVVELGDSLPSSGKVYPSEEFHLEIRGQYLGVFLFGIHRQLHR